MAKPVSNNKNTTIYKVTANNTDMVRFVTAEAGIGDRKVIVTAKAQLRQTEASSIGNASKRRMNPLWDHHRHQFLNATSFKVEVVQEHEIDASIKLKQHVVMALNRKHLQLASVVKAIEK